MRLLLLLGICFWTGSVSAGEKYFSYTRDAGDIYELIISLRFAEAEQALERLQKDTPDNLVALHLANYLDVFAILISEDEALYQERRENRDARLVQLQRADPASPWYLFVQADVRLQWALLRLRFGEIMGAFNDVSKAYQLLERNQQDHPDFMPNYKDLGILHAVVGTVPDQYRWGVRLLSGVDGSIRQGKQELERVLEYAKNNSFLFAQETAVLYAYFVLHLQQDPEQAWAVVQGAGLTPKSNPLHCFILANIAMRSHRNDQALRILVDRPRGHAFASIPYLDFMEGLVRLRRLEPGTAKYFQRYLDAFRGRNFIKEAYQKMAWSALLSGDEDQYWAYMEACRQKGYDDAGPDKNALLEAEAERLPPIGLLQARLLFDGGYMQKAYEVLILMADRKFAQEYHQLEYTYRMGRVLHGLNEHNAALLFYKKTIQSGRASPYYFACNAALQSGLIYEEMKQPTTARRFFTLCLSMKPDDYRTGLHQAAKAGLKRLE